MRPALVVKPNPVTDDSIGMLQGLKPLTMNTLLFQSSDHTLDHPVLLGTVRCDELLSQAVASHQGCEASIGKDQAIIRSQKKRLLYFAQSSKSSNQGLLQSGFCRLGFARTRQVPAQKLSGVAVNHQGKRHPAVSSRPCSAKVCSPALIRRGRYRGWRLHSWSKPNWGASLPVSLGSGRSAERCSCSYKKARHGSVAIRKILLNHGLNRLLKTLLHFGRAFNRFVVRPTSGHFKPLTKLGH